MKKGKVFLGILTGTAAGALLGILFAPRKGKDTRNKITNTTKEYADTIKKKYDDTLNSITKEFKKLKNEVSDLSHHGSVKEEELNARVKLKEEKLKKDYGVEIS